MTWTYGGDPSANDRDQVRFLIGDTDTTDQLVTDEEIAWALTQGSVYYVAAICADAIAAKFSRLADKAVDDLKLNLSQKSKQYRELANELRERDSLKSVAGVYAGGISESDKLGNEEDTDRVAPSFSRGMNDNPSSVNQDQ